MRKFITKQLLAKLKADTGGGCSVCGFTPCVNVEGTYWLCGECVNEQMEDEAVAVAVAITKKFLEALQRMDAARNNRSEPGRYHLTPTMTVNVSDYTEIRQFIVDTLRSQATAQ